MSPFFQFFYDYIIPAQMMFVAFAISAGILSNAYDALSNLLSREDISIKS